MNQPKLLLAAILLSFGVALGDEPATRPTAPPISGKLGAPVELFNGKDLVGWTVFTKVGQTTATRPSNPDELWYVKDGILHDKGNPFGYIRRDGVYSNYVLLVEQRHVEKGNSGVFFAFKGPDAIWPHCLECQTLNGDEGDIRGITNFHMTCDPARTEARRFRKIGPSSEKPVGEWETIRIVVDSGNLSVYVNDVLQNLATKTGDLSGCIALQAEGGDMEFRKVELTPIE
jgi:hypothetical protein